MRSRQRCLQNERSAPSRQTLKRLRGGGALIVRVDRIKPFPGQPRKHFDVDELGSLADSLKQEGQQAPVIVVKSGDPDYDYELVDGERRWRAAKLIGLKELFAVLTTVEDAGKQHLKAVILNFNRAEHPPIEVSNALHYQMTEGGKTSSELAAALGKSVAWVYQHLSLQKLHQDLQRLLGPPTPKEEQLRMQIAHLLSRAPKEAQLALYSEITAVKNPRLQILKAKEALEPYTDKSKTSRKRPPIESVDVFLAFVERLHGDLARTKTNPPSVYLSLVTNRQSRLRDVKAVLAQARIDLGALLATLETTEANVI